MNYFPQFIAKQQAIQALQNVPAMLPPPMFAQAGGAPPMPFPPGMPGAPPGMLPPPSGFPQFRPPPGAPPAGMPMPPPGVFPPGFPPPPGAFPFPPPGQGFVPPSSTSQPDNKETTQSSDDNN